MKTKDLERLIESAVRKIIQEDSKKFRFSGFYLARAFENGDWSMIKDDIEGIVPNPEEYVEKLKHDIYVEEIDLENEWENYDYEASTEIDNFIETATPIIELKKWAPNLYEDNKKWKYWGLLPVDYNRGTDFINIMFALDPKYFKIVEGEY